MYIINIGKAGDWQQDISTTFGNTDNNWHIKYTILKELNIPNAWLILIHTYYILQHIH